MPGRSEQVGTAGDCRDKDKWKTGPGARPVRVKGNKTYSHEVYKKEARSQA